MTGAAIGSGVGAGVGSGVSRLGGLAKTSLREQALDVLRNAVTSGEIAPGTHLVETELSAALSISRGTLREALRQLEQEGLVEPSERGRLRVRTLNAAEIADMFQVRSALEGLAAASLCRLKNRKPVVKQLQAALDALAAADGSINEMVEIDLEFHRTMCTLTGNAALLRSWEGLAGSIRMSIMFAGAEQAMTNMSVPRHQVLVDAVAAGDPDQARIAVEEHMLSAADNLMTDFDSGSRDTA
jgi:DNA-binding GntR family transcriptional regulator